VDALEASEKDIRLTKAAAATDFLGVVSKLLYTLTYRALHSTDILLLLLLLLNLNVMTL